jgi:simple sugar transport system permease protein
MPPMDWEVVRVAILFATPLLMAAVGELVVERAGVVNIGIEGMMLSGALAAWAVNAFYGRGWGFVAAGAAAAVLAILFIAAAVWLGADQIVTGTGINLLALGLTGLAYRRLDPLVAQRHITATAEGWMIAAVAVLLVLVWLYFRFTRPGLELSAIGESPDAADAAGVNVNARKSLAVLFGAACAGLAGAYLSTMRVRQFTENMTEGLGFLALAIVIFGRWRPIGILLAALFFTLVRAGANFMEARGVVTGNSVQLLKMTPYVVSLLALAGVGGRSGAPAALGRPYLRN